MKGKSKDYVYWGTTAALVILVGIAFTFLMMRADQVKAAYGMLNQILAPIIYGAIMAYLLCPVFNHFNKWGEKLWQRAFKSQTYASRFGKFLGSVASLVLLLVVMIGLVWMIIPQVMNSLTLVISNLPANAERLSALIRDLFAENPSLEGQVLHFYNQGIDMLINWSTKDLMPNLEKVIGGVFIGVWNMLIIMKNVLIGIVVMIYLLNMKDHLAAQAKKLVYGSCRVPLANYVIQKIRLIHKIFGGFIIGKLIDSLIIGILCFICLSIMKMPYVILISVIVGVTNVIPFFGPFIGAVPSAILILMVNPIQCISFLIFIFLLQQFDGNILGPKILGDSTGLSSFWVLFSILLFGGLLGPIGMVIGVPTFAVIYQMIAERITESLKKKKLPADTGDYYDLDYIDEENKTFIR